MAEKSPEAVGRGFDTRTMNIFELPSFPLTAEVTTLLAEKGNVRIERIISTRQVSDWYDQNETEFVVLLAP